MNQLNRSAKPQEDSSPSNSGNSQEDNQGPDPEQPRVDPLARALYLVLRDRSEADRRFVYRALTARLSAGPTNKPERVELALRALSLCLHDLGGEAPSRRSYDTWRQSQERPDEYPSSTTIRNTFASSWPKALEALGVKPAPDVLARRLLDISREYSPDDSVMALQTCARALKPERLTFEAYRDWAREELGKPNRPANRLPLSQAVFTKHFGSWGQALDEAGLGYLLRSRPGTRDGGGHGPSSAYSQERILKTLLEAAAEQEGQRLKMTDYEQWRKRRLKEARARGEVHYLAGGQTIQRHFGSWPRALEAAGLISNEEASLARQQGPRQLSDQELVQWLAQALASQGERSGSPELGGPVKSRLTRGDYRRWRDQYLRQANPNQPRPPSEALIRQRLGSWGQALQRAGDQLNKAAKEDGDGADLVAPQATEPLHRMQQISGNNSEACRSTGSRDGADEDV